VLRGLYDYSWLVGIVAALVVYLLLARLTPSSAVAPAPAVPQKGEARA
jgi:cytosine/uracil/thiamine/allantoin permease